MLYISFCPFATFATFGASAFALLCAKNNQPGASQSGGNRLGANRSIGYNRRGAASETGKPVMGHAAVHPVLWSGAKAA
jgi:hypothetical protein